MIYRVWLHILSRVAQIRAERAQRRCHYYSDRFYEFSSRRDKFDTRLLTTSKFNRKDMQ